MACIISLEKLTEIVVNIDRDLFKKYETGIRSHFTAYMEKNHGEAFTGNQVDMGALGTGIHALRKDYLTKNCGDYGPQDCAEFSIEGQDLINAQYTRINPVEKLMEGYYNDPGLIHNVYVKRSAVTGRLIPCVNQKYAETFLSMQKVSENVERQYEEIETMVEDYETKQGRKFSFEKDRVINLIAERTAEIILNRMNLSQAV